MKHRPKYTAGIVGAFFAGQAIMLGLVCLLRPTPAGAQAATTAEPGGDPGVITARAIMLRAETNGPGMQLSAVGASGGPVVSLFDAAGLSRMQLTVDAKGKPTVILRDKSGAVALGIGLDNETPVIAVRTAGGKMATVPLPKEAAAP